MKTFRAAKTIVNNLDKVTNLQLQKLLYIAHMFSLGMGKGRIIDGNFEAWDYGPVEPSLYHKVKAFGSKPIPDIFPVEPYKEGDPEYDIIKQVIDAVGDAPASKLVAITHWENGAWAKNYQPGVRGIIIPDEDIKEEYDARLKEAESKSSN